MSTTPLDLPILISQLPHLQQAAGAQHMPQEAQQVLFGQMVADQQRQVEHKVQEVEKEDGLDAMGRDTGGNKNAGQQMPRHQRKARPEPEAGGRHPGLQRLALGRQHHQRQDLNRPTCGPAPSSFLRSALLALLFLFNPALPLVLLFLLAGGEAAPVPEG